MKTFMFAISLLMELLSDIKIDANISTILKGVSRLPLIIWIILCSIDPIYSIVGAFQQISFDLELALLLILTATIYIVAISFILVESIRALRVIDYYIHRKETFENGYEDVGIITKIVRISDLYRSRGGIFRYLLLVDCNGEKIKSLYFFDKRDPVKYSVGENINIKMYKHCKYVMLEKDYSIYSNKETFTYTTKF